MKRNGPGEGYVGSSMVLEPKPKQITARYNGICAKCGRPTHKGATITWDPPTRKAWHPKCDNKPFMKKKKSKKKKSGYKVPPGRPARGRVRLVS